MMNMVSGVTAELPEGLFAKISRYRYRVFVETLHWKLSTPEGIELDQFDGPDTVYVTAQDQVGCITGIARLLPTDGPYLLRDVFPQLLYGLTPPSSPDIWELSRFAAMDFNSQTAAARTQLSSPIAVQLLRASIQCAAAKGAKRLITVSPIGVERLLRRAGFYAHRAGPPIIVDSHPLFACWIEVGEPPAAERVC
jgi:acyl homoserine lactone synthase